MLTIDRPPWVFVSYRRADGGSWIARRIASELTAYLGPDSVFCDISSIPVASNWSDVILQALLNSTLCLVLIHTGWPQERLLDSEDWVRREVSMALQRGKTVMPVLVDGASMPLSRDLPDELKSLATIQGAFVEGRSDASLAATTGVLAREIMSSFQSRLVLEHERPHRVGNDGSYKYVLRIDGEPVLTLEGPATTATGLTPSGVHIMSTAWSEHGRDKHPREAQVTGPSYWSYGETVGESFTLRPGAHTFTLREYPERRSMWTKVTDGIFNKNSSSRELVEESFVPQQARKD
jgi:hypothetical protein